MFVEDFYDVGLPNFETYLYDTKKTTGEMVPRKCKLN